MDIPTIITNLPISVGDPSEFWKNVAIAGQDECWLWRGRLQNDAYGEFGRNETRRRAHRIAWTLTHGAVPDGHQVQHLCDVRYPPQDITYRRCCNPAHLTTGLTDENMRHASESGRMPFGKRNGRHTHPETTARGDRHGWALHPDKVPRGERNARHTHPETTARGERSGSAKLSDAQAQDILDALLSGKKRQIDIVREYGIHKATVSCLATGRNWKHLRRDVVQ